MILHFIRFSKYIIYLSIIKIRQPMKCDNIPIDTPSRMKTDVGQRGAVVIKENKG